MKSGKKIVRIFSRLNIGGPSLHVVNLTSGLREFGYQTVLIVGAPDKFEGSMMSYATENQVEPHFIPELGPSISPFKDLVAFFKILKVIKDERPDIVHTHTFKAGLLGRVAATLLRVPVVVHTYHGHLLAGYGSSLRAATIKVIEKSLCFFTNRAVAVSLRVAKDIVGAGIIPGRRMSVVELGFNVENLKREMALPATFRRQRGISINAKVIAIVGRLVPVKSIDLFLTAMIPVLKKRPEVHLAILGDGPLKNSLEALADLLSESDPAVRSRIHFDGWTVPLVNEFKEIDLCVCSSRNEGTSVAIIEAILCGVPVISTHVGGMGDLLEEGRWGKLVPYQTQALTEAVEQVLSLQEKSVEDPARLAFDQQVKDASREFWSRFDAKRLVSSVADLYQAELRQLRSRDPSSVRSIEQTP